jgi:hypothetical protein
MMVIATDAVMTASQTNRTSVITVLKEGVETYGYENDFSEQCATCWRFIQCSKELCQECTLPKTTDCIYMASIIPSAEEWRILGDVLQKEPSSELGRIHTWWWYRFRGVLKDFSHIHHQQMLTCMQWRRLNTVM